MSIIGLTQNTHIHFVRYCFFNSGHYLSTITTSIYVRDRDLNLISDYDHYRY